VAAPKTGWSSASLAGTRGTEFSALCGVSAKIDGIFELIIVFSFCKNRHEFCHTVFRNMSMQVYVVNENQPQVAINFENLT
jgi:hypothetical protein